MNNSNQKKRLPAWILIFKYSARVLLVLMLAALSFCAVISQRVHHPFQPIEMSLAQYTPRDVVGDLGGIAVNIPRELAEFVEYDGDPGFGEKRKGPVPERTYQSKLNSLGYYVRFPSIEELTPQELLKDRQKFNEINTPWIHVGIIAGESYPGDGFLDRQAKALIEVPDGLLKHMNYEKLPLKEHGLDVYAAKGIDPKTSRPYREHDDAEDVFINRDEKGRVKTYIACTNRYVRRPPCQLTFSLEPEVQAQISFIFDRKKITQWHEMQEHIAKSILSIKAKPTSAIE